MRNRWQLFTSNLVVFLAWYTLFYCLSVGGWQGVLSALAWALGTLVLGGVIGVLIGAAAHAIDLHLTDRDVRAGDARDGARITLGKLPERVAARPDSPVPPIAETPAPKPAPKPEAAPASPASPLTAQAVEPTAPAPAPTVEPTAPAPVPPDRLALECAAFTRDHSAVRVSQDGDGGGLVGSIDRSGNPADFSAFLYLIGRLSAEGVDLSPVRVTQDAAGVPAVVTFPLSTEQHEVRT